MLNVIIDIALLRVEHLLPAAEHLASIDEIIESFGRHIELSISVAPRNHESVKVPIPSLLS